VSSGHAYIIAAPGNNLMMWNIEDDVIANTSYQYVYPIKTGFVNGGTYVKTTNGKILLWPVFISYYDGTIYKLLVELDGVYFGMDNLFQSEDKVQIAAQDYLVIQNVFRTSYQYYVLFKME
jgi:hypothetical protein